MRCKVEKRIEMRRCFKCWAYEHKAAECKGPDRTKTCNKCGKEGHRYKDCDKEEACPVCNMSGHRAGTGKCRDFRRALSKARKESRAPNSQD